jgi:hypothetical protein
MKKAFPTVTNSNGCSLARKHMSTISKLMAISVPHIPIEILTPGNQDHDGSHGLSWKIRPLESMLSSIGIFQIR